ncbi:aldehyde dehydrogenase family protein [Streptomyces sp. NPDC056255]|uniref:aldehyde dehydrogenase family protein n=1 Tax=Streptomyces sp. NPDC056255 TaxID=3345764 RepID=UPI0035DD6318
MSTPSIKKAVHDAVHRARAAQSHAESWTQDRVDDVVTAIARHLHREENARRLATLSHAETGLGDPEHLYELQRRRVVGQLFELHGQTTVGTIEELPHLGLRRIAKPMGVIAAASPATAPSSGIVCSALPMLKTRNAVVFTPNPRARQAAMETVALIREALVGVGAPTDLVQCLDVGGREAAEELMRAADLVVAVGGPGTVRRAYSSGTPAVGAGVGNSTVIVDETSDVRAAARSIQTGAGYNNGTSCSSESNVLVHHSVADEFRAELLRSRAHLCTRAETLRIRRALWPDGRNLNRDLIGRSAEAVALAAGVDLAEPDKTTALVLDGDGEASDSPALCEKLSPVVTLLTYDDFDVVVDRVKDILDRCGRGHSAGIHSRRPSRVDELADRIPTCRIVVNQSTMTNSGSFTSGVPFTSTLASGTWGGTSVSGNVTWRSFVNLTTVTWPIPERHVDEALLFGRHGTASSDDPYDERTHSRHLENVL